MTANLLLKRRLWDDFIVLQDFTVFPCLFSFRNFPANVLPVFFFLILTQTPLLEVSLVL